MENDKDTRIIYKLVNKNDKSEVIYIYLRYKLGGYSYFTGNIHKRGYYLMSHHCYELTHVTAEGYTWHSSQSKLMSGFQHFIQEASRFNAKTFNYIASRIIYDYGDEIAQMIRATAQEAGKDQSEFSEEKGA